MDIDDQRLAPSRPSPETKRQGTTPPRLALSWTTPRGAAAHRLEQPVVIGRAETCDVVLADRTVSRRHARISPADDGWWLEDLGSRSGTWLNGRALDARGRLTAGDRIGAGQSVLRVVAAGGVTTPTDGSPPPPPGTSVFRRADEVLASARAVGGGEDDAATLRRHAERLELLNEVHEALGRSPKLEELLELILDSAFEALAPEEGILVLRDGRGVYRTVASRRTSGMAAETPLSQTLTEEVIEKRQAALVADVTADDRFDDATSLLAMGVRSLIAAPLFDSEGPLGMLALTSRAHAHPFGEDDLELLTSLASVASLRVRNVALAEEAAEHRRLEGELALARSIQVGLMPRRPPTPAGWSIFGACAPSRLVSGDFYLFCERPGTLDVLVVDVAGKGIAAALLTASLEALLAQPLASGHPPEEVFTRVSALLDQRTPAAKYATALLARVELASGRFRLANAGHLPAVVVRANGRVDTFAATGPPLGLLPESVYTAHEGTLARGDLFSAFTDGIVEAANVEEQEFGVSRLLEGLRDARDPSLPALASAIDGSVTAFVGDATDIDDRTLVLLRRE